MKTPIEIIEELAVKLTGSTFPVSGLYIQAMEAYAEQYKAKWISDVEAQISVYVGYINNLDWHLKNNAVTPEAKDYLENRIIDFMEMRDRLKQLLPSPPTL